MTQEQIIDAGISYTMQKHPNCIGGSAFDDMVRQINRNPSFEAGAKWTKENLIKEVITWMKGQVYQEYSCGPLERLITDEMIDNFKKAMDKQV